MQKSAAAMDYRAVEPVAATVRIAPGAVANANAGIRCGRCGADNRGSGRFCEACGVSLEQRCPACGDVVHAGRPYCGSCGRALPQPRAAHPAQPDQALSQPLAQRVLPERGALDGERKQVTVLFADLKGSLELLADRDPEDARKLIQPVLERMMDAVHRYEGTVN